MVASGEEFRSSRRTNRADVETVEGNPALCDRVDMRRSDLGIARRRVVTPPCVIGEKYNEVRCSGPSCCEREKDRSEAKEADLHET